MDNILAIDLIINRGRYPKIYNSLYIIFFVLFIFVYVILIYQYEDYYLNYGKLVDNKLVVHVKCEDVFDIQNNNTILIANRLYSYDIASINYENGHYNVYINVFDFYGYNNYIYEFKIAKGKQRLVNYLFS